MGRYCWLVSVIFVFLSIRGICEEEGLPWFTGPLIAPRGEVVPKGEFELDSYAYISAFTGDYQPDWNSISTPNFYQFNPQLLLFVGLTPWLDLNIVPQFSINWTEGVSSVGFNDLLAGFDFQLYSAEAHSWFPGIKLALKELFPTGKYQNLNPNKLLTDQMGAGAFTTYLALVLYKIYPLTDTHFLSFTLSGEYGVSTSTHVRGLNAFGGGEGTDGKVQQGNVFQAICSFELNVTNNWAFAIDNVWSHANQVRFIGDPGVDSNGDFLSVGGPSTDTLSFCPSIEYNFSEKFGIIAGCWFSAIGRNSSVFRSGAVNFYTLF